MKRFYSRLLLFGEYAQSYGSYSLVVPFDLFSGGLVILKGEDVRKNESRKILFDFCQFLKKNKEKFFFLNIESFEAELNEGLCFDSDLPGNYGLGESGVLIATVFDRYHYMETDGDVQNLRVMFANMESWFFGKSLGIDSLASYLGQPVVLRNKIAEKITFLPRQDDDFDIFLIDTSQESSTGFQTRSFQQIIGNKMFYYLFLENYVPYINSAITFFLGKNLFNFNTALTNMVDFQYKYFKVLFPSFTRDLIKAGLDEGSYFLKLCGAGGGGYLLGFTQDIEYTKGILAQKGISVIHVTPATNR
jgi:mevalonate kinase